MNSAIERAEKKVEQVTKKALKAATVFIMVLIGLIFILVGLSKYLDVALKLQPGVGLMLVGIVLFLLGLFAKLVRD